MDKFQMINKLRELAKSLDVIENMEYEAVNEGLTDLDAETKTNLEFLHSKHNENASSLDFLIDMLEKRIYNEDQENDN